MILAGDIGGTKTNLALFSSDSTGLRQATTVSYQSREFRSLPEVIARFRHEHPAEITHAAFGIAGPVVNGTSKLTNLGWNVVGSEVANALGLHAVGLINDLEATSYGTLRLGEKDKITIQPGTPQQYGPIAVAAAGTGLGEGALVWDGRRYRSLPSEGGHSDFGPRNELEIELLRFLISKYGRVSYERVVAGPGIMNLYEFFRIRADYPEPSWLTEQFKNGDPSAVVSQAGLNGKDSVCVMALELFTSLYGAETGNLALKILATGGVYVGGGIGPKIQEKILSPAFIQSFYSKGRYTDLLKRIPVYLILNDKTALLGAAHFALVMNT
jgi:glucokinase